MTGGPSPLQQRPAIRLPRLWSAQGVSTGRAEGDMGHGGAYVHAVRPEVEARRRAVVDRPWTWLRQVHGNRVVRVTSPGDGAGAVADAAVCSTSGCAIAILTADCGPVVLDSPEGVFAVAHAGWVGLTNGVLEATVSEMRALGATEIGAVLGPCIRVECYEFGPDDLDRVAHRLGDGVRGVTPSGAPALDLAAGVRAALANAGVDRFDDIGVCTACSPDHFSWRARAEQQRQATVVWR
ncbi:MAG: purine-nucleoside/S-methyl-5-thioadenosine phosphorylase / adenosine deaminase [Actinomycetota bacterium]|jgi:YfiH family protein|nr:purine-nucleoside/S-methyl-5-thioadenosine phosphorylase / adenosine deaminase [Actinomycetota bacterium]